MGTSARPLPAGPRSARQAVSYLCAFVVISSPAAARAEGLAAYLLSPRAQALLSGAGVGLPLRPGAAAAALRARHPRLRGREQLADPSPDLTLRDLFGAWKTPATAALFDAVSDGFATYVGQQLGAAASGGG